VRRSVRAPLSKAAHFWFALTAIAAALAATQDVFVDAFAVRVLRPSERGYGNTAQVAGYRLGMLIGGAALLLLVERLGERATLLGCAALVAIASVGAFAGSADARAGTDATENSDPRPRRSIALLAKRCRREPAGCRSARDWRRLRVRIRRESYCTTITRGADLHDAGITRPSSPPRWSVKASVGKLCTVQT
jgi:hypothetical protein